MLEERGGRKGKGRGWTHPPSPSKVASKSGLLSYCKSLGKLSVARAFGAALLTASPPRPSFHHVPTPLISHTLILLLPSSDFFPRWA